MPCISWYLGVAVHSHSGKADAASASLHYQAAACVHSSVLIIASSLFVSLRRARSWCWCTMRILRSGCCLTSWKTCLTKQKFKLNAKTSKDCCWPSSSRMDARHSRALSAERNTLGWRMAFMLLSPATVHHRQNAVENEHKVFTPRPSLRSLHS